MRPLIFWYSEVMKLTGLNKLGLIIQPKLAVLRIKTIYFALLDA